MSQLMKYAVGIDASLEQMDVCLLEVNLMQETKIKATHKFANTTADHKELSYWLKKRCKESVPIELLMEATGVYYERMAIFLVDEKYAVSVVLPNRARKYMQAMGLKSKNDRIDAKGLALMCSREKCIPWQPISKYYHGLRELTRHHESLQKQKTSVNNQLHAISHSAYDSKEVSKQLRSTRALLDKQLVQTVHLIKECVNSNAEVKHRVANLCKIKGVDVLTVATVIAETNGFALIKNAGQLVSYAGYDVIENQSGKHRGKTRISKKGNSHIRRALHMPALNVVRWEPHPFGNLYERVFERSKIKMVGYVAVQKKLLIIIYALWGKNEPFDSNYGKMDTSGNVESRALFPLPVELEARKNFEEVMGSAYTSRKKGLSLNGKGKKIVPLNGGTTQDGHRYKVSSEALFPLGQN